MKSTFVSVLNFFNNSLQLKYNLIWRHRHLTWWIWQAYHTGYISVLSVRRRQSTYVKLVLVICVSSVKKKHLKDLKTIDHSVVAFSDKYNNISTQEICARHPRNVYKRFCETCHEPVCDSLFGNLYHRYRFPLFKHNILCIREVYRAKREKHRETIHAIGSEAFFYRPLLMSEIKAAFKTCLTNVFLYQSELITKTKTFKGLIDYIQNDLHSN